LKKIFIITLLSFLLTACAGSSTQPAAEFTLDASDFAYSVPSMTVKVGEPVQLTINNVGALEHDFVIEQIDAATKVIQDSGSEEHHAHGAEAKYDLHVSAQVGETSIIEFTVNEPGTYQFFCSVPGHKDAGMVGELTVVTE